MTIEIPDSWLAETGAQPREVAVEIACRLFAAQMLYKSQAAKLAGLTRVEFEDELAKRGLPWIIYTLDMLEDDLKTLKPDRGKVTRAGHQ